MTISSRKNYNIFALRGEQSIDDMEVVEQFGLDPALAYTPALNEAAADAQMKDNIANGVDEKEARKTRDNIVRAAHRLMKM